MQHAEPRTVNAGEFDQLAKREPHWEIDDTSGQQDAEDPIGNDTCAEYRCKIP